MATYRKIDTRIWNDARFNSASLSCQHLFLFIITHPGMTMVGGMRTTAAGLEAELHWQEKGFPEPFAEAFAEGATKGFWKYDRKAHFLVVPKFVRYNPPANPNVVRSWIGIVSDLPECSLLDLLKQQLADYLKGLSKPFAEPFEEAFPEPFGKGLPKQKQKQKKKLNTCPGPKGPDVREDLFDQARKHGTLNRNDNRKAALKAWKARVRAGVDPEHMAQAWRDYRDWCEAEGRTVRHVMHQKTFYGPDEHWARDYAVKEAPPMDDWDDLRRVCGKHGLTVPGAIDRDFKRARAWVADQVTA